MATAQATAQYFQPSPAAPGSVAGDPPAGSEAAAITPPRPRPRPFADTGWSVAPIGFGAYRADVRIRQHAEALHEALLRGFNLIDTSSNYTDGNSEWLVGAVTEHLRESGELNPDAAILVTKVGYVQGRNMLLVEQREQEGRPYPEVVRYADGCWHCIHPDFLADQLALQLERLRRASLDVYLLHNPEYFLSDARKRRASHGEARTEYHRRIRAAFTWLEERAAEGRISAYGVSSNTFIEEPDEFEFTSLEALLAIAREVGGENHRFRVVQFPLNLVESGAFALRNQRASGATVLELARNAGLATLANRPLNAIAPGGAGMIRLASFREEVADTLRGHFPGRIDDLQQLETRFADDILPRLPSIAGLSAEKLHRVFSLARQLANALDQFGEWEQWDHVRKNLVEPQMAAVLGHIATLLRDDKTAMEWVRAYGTALASALDDITLHYETIANARSRRLASALDSACPELAGSPTLSQKALRVLASLPGLDVTLLGMRQTGYVSDALAACAAPPISNPGDAFEAVARALR